MSAPTAALESVTYGCLKCCGTGRLPNFRHIENGVCFTCGGTGLVTGQRRPVDAVPVADPSKRYKALTPAQCEIILAAYGCPTMEVYSELVCRADIIATRTPDGLDFVLDFDLNDEDRDESGNMRDWTRVGSGRIWFRGKPGAWTDVEVSDGLRRRISPRQAVALLDAIAR